MTSSEEAQVNAQFNTLVTQRNAAHNDVVNLNGQLAAKDIIIQELQMKVAELSPAVVATPVNRAQRRARK